MNFVLLRRLIILLTLLNVHRGISATLVLQPSADTTLIEAAPTNNMGGTEFVNAGTSGTAYRNRGLYKFNFDSIPPGSKIKTASVTLEVIGEPGAGGASSPFGIYRMLRNWGEGDKVSTPETQLGFGQPATTNEATWNSPFAFSTNNWIGPGASNDFAATSSSGTQVYGLADFPEFASTPQMVSDVQGWVNNPGSNFGWLLKSELEETLKTARRFGSREFVGEDTNSPPYVRVDFTPLPAIFGMQATNQQFRFMFSAESNQAYRVEYKNALETTNAWLTLTNINALNNSVDISIADSISTNTRFYRVIFP